MVDINEVESQENRAQKFGNPYDSIILDGDNKKGCCYYIKFFDRKILRPILIYKYNDIFEHAGKHIDFEEMLEEYKQIH